MEAVKTRSESPITKSKTKGQASDVPENGDLLKEQAKMKKKQKKNRHKSQINGEPLKNGIETNTDDAASNQADTDHNGIGQTDDNKENDQGSDNSKESAHQTPGEVGLENKTTDEVTGVCCDVPLPKGSDNNKDDAKQIAQEVEPENRMTDKITEVGSDVQLDKGSESSKESAHQTPEEVELENGMTDGIGGRTQETYPADCSDDKVTNDFDEKTPDEKELINETESSAKERNALKEDSPATTFEATNGNEDLDNEAVNGMSNVSTEVNIEDVSFIESTHNGLNGSDDGSHYEDAQTKEDCVQASPDTAQKDESFFSNKISNFLGIWTPSSPQLDAKQDLVISSSQKANGDDSLLIHPYLGKVSGRRGIRERMNCSATSLNSKDEDMKTPTNVSAALDNSFRVRTNPTRLNPADIQINSTLRKFKGKRCLNANDEPEDGDEEEYLASSKRRKLNDKAQDSGLLRTILWSPFRRSNIKNESSKPSNSESKLSRFLSPFWFWKKTAVSQEGNV